MRTFMNKKILMFSGHETWYYRDMLDKTERKYGSCDLFYKINRLLKKYA